MCLCSRSHAGGCSAPALGRRSAAQGPAQPVLAALPAEPSPRGASRPFLPREERPLARAGSASSRPAALGGSGAAAGPAWARPGRRPQLAVTGPFSAGWRLLLVSRGRDAKRRSEILCHTTAGFYSPPASLTGGGEAAQCQQQPGPCSGAVRVRRRARRASRRARRCGCGWGLCFVGAAPRSAARCCRPQGSERALRCGGMRARVCGVTRKGDSHQ